jgi:type I restriction enzyme S subunit
MSNKVGEENKKSGARRPLVPRLRFSEFRKAEEWDNKPLEACLDYEQPTDYLVSSTNYANTHETPVLTAGKTFILGYTNEKEGVYKDNLPVIIFDDFTTACQFVNFPFKVKSSAMKILHAKNGCSTKFMYELLKMISYEVGAHERHWISKFAPMLVPVPRPKEQQKIADCLSSLDDLITLESQKLNALKTHKKGLMQQLFPAEGETVPRLRFPEFREAGDWDYKSGGLVFDQISNKDHNCDLPLLAITQEQGAIPRYLIEKKRKKKRRKK